ncbi:hypothetical protein SRB5_14290 [Streptomyces sp. RB5]|uniref:Superoxide dismutase n=1 Tax=Streptomyces smaragdinus TaxID=2585196 RepID=A0A7K0CEX3_9ACTN|nr:superoxide dismutase family protein [Streptomyces smaragdinus]MQY11314.1 hypothetical protein [Streptomyces smaragdinus]
MRTALTLTAIALAAATLPATTSTAAAPAAPTAQPPVGIVLKAARFAPPTAFVRSDAITYDTTLVPAGAFIGVAEIGAGGETHTEIGLHGLLPDRAYGAHVHTKPCGYTPEESGPHYQNDVDPVQPSTDPAYANPENEVWLDFTTDSRGEATAGSVNDWRFRRGGARSIVVHEHGTATDPGHAGTAGDRLACFSVRLK